MWDWDSCSAVADQGKMKLVGANLLPSTSLFSGLTFPLLCVVLSSLRPDTLLCLGLGSLIIQLALEQGPYPDNVSTFPGVVKEKIIPHISAISLLPG